MDAPGGKVRFCHVLCISSRPKHCRDNQVYLSYRRQWRCREKKTAQEWFTKFKSDIPNLTDTSRPDRQYELNNEHLKALLKKDDRQITRKSTKKTNCSHRPSTIISSPLGLHRRLKFEYLINFLAPTGNYGLMLHLNIPPGIERHVTTMTQALHRWSEVTLLRQHVSEIKTSGALGGKFKLRVWPNLHKKKIMFRVWWDFMCLIHWELLFMNVQLICIFSWPSYIILTWQSM